MLVCAICVRNQTNSRRWCKEDITQTPEWCQQVWTGPRSPCYGSLSPPRSFSRCSPIGHSAGGQIQSWSWAPPCDSEGERLGSTRSRTDRPPSGLLHRVLVETRRCDCSSAWRRCCRSCTHRLWGRFGAPLAVSPVAGLSCIPPVNQVQEEDRDSGSVSRSRLRSLRNSGRAPGATGGQMERGAYKQSDRQFHQLVLKTD